ncbi:MAG TPA: protein kinase [Gemmataceae bacterium]|nr:protein kinase [Gemmataceae bacterium]
MPPPASANELLDLVQKSGVTDAARLQTYMQKLSSASGTPTEPAKMAGMLVRDGILTHFQAEQLLQGKWKRFTIGKYKVLEKLGAGGMGQVFLCEHKLMRRRVAVKVLPTAKAEDSSSLERFYREARAVAAVDHPNLVRAYDIDQDDNLHFLVMEFVDGTNFHDLIKKFGPLDVTRACHYIYGAAVGLQHAHEMGLVHRDIKPGNILIDRTGVVKILDLGLARFFHDEEDVLTKKYDENVLGTADYLAPEQAIDSHVVDIRADIYSLGATFYYLLTASPLFPEGSVAQKLIWHQSREPVPVKQLRPEVPDGVAAIVNKMLAKDADDRYQVPADLMAALAPWVATPIPPPPEREMPSLSLAATGAVVGTSMRGPATTAGVTRSGGSGSPTIANAPAWGNAPTAITVTPPPVHPAGAGGGENGVWESLDDETQTVAVADTDRAKPRPAEGGRKSTRGPLVLAAVVVLAVAVAAAAVYFLFIKKPAAPDTAGTGGSTGKKWIVSKAAGENTFTSLRAAVNKATAGDTIVIREERLQEPMVRFDTRSKDVTIESDLPGGKAAVFEFTSPTPVTGAVGAFSIASVPGLRVKNIEIDAKGVAEYGVQIKGLSPGLVFENVVIRGAKATGVWLDNTSGEGGEPITFDRARIVLLPNTDGVWLTATSPLESKRVTIRNSRIEGLPESRGKSGVRLEGGSSEVEITGNRMYRLENAVTFGRINPASVTTRPQITGNTFYGVDAGLHFDMTGGGAGKYAVAVSRNYFARTGALARRTDGGGPVGGVTFADNAHDKHSNHGNVPFGATKLDNPELPPPNPEDNATFLRFPGDGPEVGPNKVRVGAN